MFDGQQVVGAAPVQVRGLVTLGVQGRSMMMTQAGIVPRQ
jgi:hypothetical protein